MTTTRAPRSKGVSVLSALLLLAALLAGAASPYQYNLNQLLTVTGDSAFKAEDVKWQQPTGLPQGLTLGADGVITGVPSALDLTGTAFQVVAEYNGKTGQKIYTIVVNGAPLDVTGLALGGSHTCAITDVGSVKCWGANNKGQLGDNTVVTKLTPTLVSGLSSGVVSITAGDSHTCAVTSSGAAWCWGANDYGQLGDGSTLMRATPVSVTSLGSGVASVTAGNLHTCAITTAGEAKCWGQGHSWTARQ